MSSDCGNEWKDIFPNDLYFVVGNTSLIAAGGSVFTLPVAFEGWKIRLFRGTFAQFLSNPATGNSFWTVDYNTRIVSLSPDVGAGEEFIIQAYKPV